jgi:hypothetical protein
MSLGTLIFFVLCGIAAIISAIVVRKNYAALRTKSTSQTGAVATREAQAAPAARIDSGEQARLLVGWLNLALAVAGIGVSLFIAIHGEGGTWLVPSPIVAANLYISYDALVKRAKPSPASDST